MMGGGSGASVVGGAAVVVVGAAVVVGAVTAGAVVVVAGAEVGAGEDDDAEAEDPERSIVSPSTRVGFESLQAPRVATAIASAQAARTVRRWLLNILPLRDQSPP
jgi:hypothetical protein